VEVYSKVEEQGRGRELEGCTYRLRRALAHIHKTHQHVIRVMRLDSVHNFYNVSRARESDDMSRMT
jgi:hypothetical protein